MNAAPRAKGPRHQPGCQLTTRIYLIPLALHFAPGPAAATGWRLIEQIQSHCESVWGAQTTARPGPALPVRLRRERHSRRRLNRASWHKSRVFRRTITRLPGNKHAPPPASWLARVLTLPGSACVAAVRESAGSTGANVRLTSRDPAASGTILAETRAAGYSSPSLHLHRGSRLRPDTGITILIF